jgi:cysteine desulfurase
MRDDFGNAHSRTHPYGTAARKAVEHARDQIAAAAQSSRGEVIFTSGATESNNLAILGLEEHGRADKRTHLISTAIEHRAVLEPLQHLERRGFSLTLVPPCAGGYVDADAVAAAVRSNTLLVSVMHVNNETGVIQPLDEIARRLTAATPVYFHVDASQGFAKDPRALHNPRIDLMSVSGHKIGGPKGVGALIARRRPALAPLFYGGGQERGLRAGTLPVPLIAGLGLAAELWTNEASSRWETALAFQRLLLEGLAQLRPLVHGDLARGSPYIVNLSIPDFDSEEVIEAWADLASVSDGAACTTQSYTCSHVLSAMGVDPVSAAGAVRLSWSPSTPLPDLAAMVEALQQVEAR